MKMINITCAWCGTEKEIALKEYERQIKKGRKNFFCSLSCGAKFNNATKKNKVIEKICPVCGKKFKTNDGCKEATFCSRSCASKGSVTDYRRQKARETIEKNNMFGNVDTISHLLKKREATKYQLIEEYLSQNNIGHEFEYVIGGYVYDLCLTDRKLLIEFDESYHVGKQLKTDALKDELAKKNGWSIIRVSTPNSETIPIEVIEGILTNEHN